MTSDLAISVRQLSKQYRRGTAVRASYGTLRDSLSNALRSWYRPPQPRDDRQFWALRDISFDVSRGEVLGVIGRNGAGKSTLLKVLSRITEPTSGEVDLYGRVGSLLEVGTGFHPELSGRENIFLNGALLGMKRAEIQRQFDDIVEFAEVAAFLNTPVKHYSSGMYMRLAFAVAAHLEPEILIVDEVLAVGDAAFQKKCLGKIESVSSVGRTVLLVSHQMQTIEYLCDRCILLDRGGILADGPTDQVVRRYLDSAALSQASFDLQDMSRTGSGKVKLERFFLEDADGQSVASVSSGAPVTLAFEYRSQIGSTGSISLGFSLHTRDERLVTLLYSDYQGVTFPADAESGIIRFRCNRLPLSSGTYFVSARITVSGSESDWPRGYVGSFDVDAGDFYGAGRPFHSGIAPVLIDGDWTSTGKVPLYA